MDNFLNGGIAELEAAKEAIINEAKLSEEAAKAEKAYLSKEKDVEAQKKFMEDKINSSVRNRREELEKVHDEQISQAKKELKSAKKERRDAKNEAVNERIGNETASLSSDNARLKKQIRALFKQWKIPAFCNTKFYYAMFATKSAADFLVFALVAIICVAVIPNIVCAMIDTTTVFKILIYAGIVVAFALIYVLIFAATRSGQKANIIEKARPLRKKIALNKKMIRNMSKKIRIDDDESSYGLDHLDEEIKRIEDAENQKEADKDSAMKDFDRNTAAAIKSEIEKENLPLIEQMQAEAKSLHREFLDKQAAAQKATTTVANEYTSYLGTKNASPEKIDELIEIINSGKASTIMQALDVRNGEIRQ